MDTDTVLKIIDMIDAKLESLDETRCLHTRQRNLIKAQEYVDRGCELNGFKIHLIKYIDSLQNAVENEMNRGE